MNFEKPTSILPNKVEVQFEIERIRIPLKYLGKNADLDKEKYKSEETKTGAIFLTFDYTNVEYKIASN